MEISKHLYNANCTPKSFFVEKHFESWDPKIHGRSNYFQSNNNYPLEIFRNGIYKRKRSSYKGTMNDGTPF